MEKYLHPTECILGVEPAEATKFLSYLWCTVTVYILSCILGLTGGDEGKTL